MDGLHGTLLLALGCSVAPVDLSEKECPCAEPFVCDEDANRCVAADGCTPAVTATGFGAEWATAHVIRWAWTPVGDRADFLRYEVEIADDPSDLGTGAARIVGPDENPELAGFVLPRTGGADDIVDFTLTYGHDAGTTYVARLLVTDTSFCTFRSEMTAFNTTLDPPEEIVLYDGPRPDPGFPLPRDLRIIDEDGAMVTEHTPSRDTQCIESGEGVCSQNIRWSGLAVNASDISVGELANLALLEVDVDNATDTPSFFSRVWIQTEGGGLFRLEPFTIATGRRTIQVPLRVLDNGGTAPSLSDLANITEVNVGGQWSRCAEGESPECFGGRVLLHRARIRY